MKALFTAGLFGLVGLAMVGCADKTPARINCVPLSTISDKNPIQLRASVVNAAGVTLEGIPVAYSVNPAGVIEVTSDGTLKCVKSGSATLQLVSSNLQADFPVKCEIVGKVDVPAKWEAVLGRDVPAWDVEVFDDVGNKISPRVDVTSSDPNIVRIDGGKPVPVNVGKATITASAGGVVDTTEASVNQIILSEPLSLPDGSRRLLTLQQGVYRVEIKVGENGGGNHGVTLAWVGADCPNRAEAQTHKQRCVVADTATLTIENPAMFGFGSAVDGFINVLQVP